MEERERENSHARTYERSHFKLSISFVQFNVWLLCLVSNDDDNHDDDDDIWRMDCGIRLMLFGSLSEF